MDNPTVLTIISIVFILLGAYNMYVAARRAREARQRGEKFKWFKQINALLGIEYLLLAWVFMLTIVYRSATIPPNIKNFLLIPYLLLLVAAAVFAGLVFRRGIINSRTLRSQTRSTASYANSNGTARVLNATETASAQDRSQDLERRRERRKNAAAARRRRAGRA